MEIPLSVIAKTLQSREAANSVKIPDFVHLALARSYSQNQKQD